MSHNTEGPSDCFADLLQAAREGSATAIGQLLEDLREYLLALANRQWPTDLDPAKSPADFVQDTMLAAWQHFQQFNGQSRKEFLAWLRAILHNALHDHVRALMCRKRLAGRKTSLDTHSPRDPASRLASGALSPADEVSRQETGLVLRHCLEQLPEDERHVLRLRFHAGFSFGEAGSSLGVSEDAAQKRCTRALRTLLGRMRELEAAVV